MAMQEQKSKLSKYLLMSVCFVFAGTLIPIFIYFSGILNFITFYGIFIFSAIFGVIGIIIYIFDKEIFYGIFQNKKTIQQENNEKFLKGFKIGQLTRLIGSLITVVLFIIDSIVFFTLMNY